MSESISYIYQIIDRFTPTLRKITAQNEKFVAGMNKARGGLKRFGEKAGNLQNALAGIGAGAGLAIVSKKAMDFESVMTDVGKVVNFTSEKQFTNFRESILKTSVELGKVPKNLAQIAVAGGKLGVLPRDMNDFIGVVARTSVAFDMLESTAGEQIGSIQSKIGLTIKETGQLMDAVNFLADNTSAGGARMIEIIARTSGTLKSIDMPRKFMAGWAAFADQMEIGAELAASGLNMMIARMRKMPGMLELMVKSPQKAISGLLKSLSGLDAVTRSKQIDKLFGPEAGRFVLKAVMNMKKFDDTMKLVTDDTKFVGSMMRELTKKLGTSETAWGKIKAVVDVVAITIGDVLIPYIKAAAPIIVKAGFAFREWAKAHPRIVKIGLAIGAILAVVAPVIVVLGIVASSIGALIPVVTFLGTKFMVVFGLMKVASASVGAAIGAIALPIAVFSIAIASVGAAVYQVWKNWDYLVADFKTAVAWFKNAFPMLSKYIATAFNLTPIALINKGIKKIIYNWDQLVAKFKSVGGIISKFLNLEAGKKEFESFTGAGRAETADEKWARIRRMRQEQGIGLAARNTIASKSTLNGDIVVSAKEGSRVESAGMKTNVPGNLGFNLAGAAP